MLIIALRTLFVYIILMLFMRLLGKRQVGQMQVEELVTALLLSELAAFPIADADIPLLHAAVPVAVIILLELISSCLCTVFPRAKKLIEGAPSILIARGKLDQKQLIRCRLSPDELLAQLRQKEICSIESVDWAILEQSGQLSVILKNDGEGRKDARPLELPLIVNGAWHRTNLARLGLTKEEASRALGNRPVKDILLYTSDGESRTVVEKRKDL